MVKNPVTYFFSCVFVLLAHGAMLAAVFLGGADTGTALLLAAGVIGLDIAYFIIMPFFRQQAYSIDFLLLLVLNMSVIFQSCFGGVEFAFKHWITCIVALGACRVGYILCRDHKWLEMQKKYYYIGIGVLMLMILVLTGSRSMWISLGESTSIQPSEFIKPLFVLACATSVTEQQKRHKILGFNVVYDNLALFGLTAAICLLQWWCRDLGSLPTFVGIYAAGFLLRICYPKAKFSKKSLIGAGLALALAAVLAVFFAPEYVRERIFSDIWSDTSGNGYQQSRALIAIADGGWFGKGPGNGFLHTVFAHENDIVFATICEEWGLLFGLMTVAVLLVMVAIPLISPPRSYYHASMSACICAAFTVQMALNIFGSCNMIPFTGVTIPFISSGGSSMLVSGLMIGMLSACQSPVFRDPEPYRVNAEPPKRRHAV